MSNAKTKVIPAWPLLATAGLFSVALVWLAALLFLTGVPVELSFGVR